MLSPFTVEMSAKMGLNTHFLIEGFCLYNQHAYSRNEPLFEEMSADPGARLMKKKGLPQWGFTLFITTLEYIYYYTFTLHIYTTYTHIYTSN